MEYNGVSERTQYTRSHRFFMDGEIRTNVLGESEGDVLVTLDVTLPGEFHWSVAHEKQLMKMCEEACELVRLAHGRR
jgi:hypothetical protein